MANLYIPRGKQQAAVSAVTVTHTANAPGAANGAVTIADGSTPTVAELQEFCVELNAKIAALTAVLAAYGLTA